MTEPERPFKLRIPASLRVWLDSQAQQNRRSCNREIIYRLQAAMRADQKAESPAAGEASQA